MPKQKVTAKAKYPDQTQKFIQDVSAALKDFEENISFPGEEIRASAYPILLRCISFGVDFYLEPGPVRKHGTNP